MDTYGMISYVVSVCSMVLFIVERQVISVDLKRKFMAGRNKFFIRIVGPNKREQEAFVNFKEDYLKIGNRIYVKNHETQTTKEGTLPGDSPAKLVPYTKAVEAEITAALKAGTLKKGNIYTKLNDEGYVLDEMKSTYKGKYPVFTYRYDNPEPRDLFEEKREIVIPGDEFVVQGQALKAKCAACNAEVDVQVPDATMKTPDKKFDVLSPKPVDNNYYDLIIQKAYSLGKIKEAGKGLNLNPKMLIIGAIVIGIAYYLYTQQGAGHGTIIKAVVPLGGMLFKPSTPTEVK